MVAQQWKLQLDRRRQLMLLLPGIALGIEAPNVLPVLHPVLPMLMRWWRHVLMLLRRRVLRPL